MTGAVCATHRDRTGRSVVARYHFATPPPSWLRSFAAATPRLTPPAERRGHRPACGYAFPARPGACRSDLRRALMGVAHIVRRQSPARSRSIAQPSWPARKAPGPSPPSRPVRRWPRSRACELLRPAQLPAGAGSTARGAGDGREVHPGHTPTRHVRTQPVLACSRCSFSVTALSRPRRFTPSEFLFGRGGWWCACTPFRGDALRPNLIQGCAARPLAPRSPPSCGRSRVVRPECAHGDFGEGLRLGYGRGESAYRQEAEDAADRGGDLAES
ncbi:hypothetical protein QFZ58_000276 [Streptomyces sp. B1I3]|nr:hypothetical protein [Streptomyces sp. B1I3]